MKLTVLLFLAVLTACAAHKQPKPLPARFMEVPASCIVVDRFYGDCKLHREGKQIDGNDCRAHIHVKHIPQCAQYDTQQIFQVPK
jgi:hypothetical protein